MSLPFSGRVFDPLAEELISYYLRNHILRLPYRESGLVREAQVYGGEMSPWEQFCNPLKPYSWIDGEPPTLFLFTKVEDIGKTEKSGGVQKNRITGCGTWHGTKSVHLVESFDEKTVIGNCKVLSFRSLNGEETMGQWTIYEYGISGEAFPEVCEVEGWQNQVICKIRRDDSKSSIAGKVTNKRKAPLPKNKKPSSTRVTNKRRKTVEMEEPVVVEAVEPVAPGDDDYFGELPESEMEFDWDDLFNSIEVVEES